MDGLDRGALNALMARMAAGEAAAAFELHELAGSMVRGNVARIARSMGANHLRPDELDGLALDVCIELIKLAPAWNADGGALPWVWGHHRVRAIVTSYIGQYGPTYDDALHGDDSVGPLPSPALDVDEADDLAVLDRLADRRPVVGVLRDALGEVATERNRRAVLLYAVQQSLGDPSPSHTVAEALGLRPDNVRQIVSRARRRLQELAAADPRYVELDQLAFLGLAEAA